MFDISFDLLDHLFSRGNTDEAGKPIETKYEKTKYSKDQIFIVASILFLIIGYLFIHFRKRLKKHFKKKYGQQNIMELQQFAPKHSGTMYIA